MKFFQRSAQDFQNTNRKFFEDIEKYPKVMRYIDESRKENLDSAMEFYRKGVEQGIFRNDVNYNIVRAMVCEQMDLLLHSEIMTSPIRLVKFMKQLYLCICVAFPLKRG